MRKTNGNSEIGHIFNLRTAMKDQRLKPVTPIQIIIQAYNDASTGTQFAAWFNENKNTLITHEGNLLDIAYQDGVSDAIQDPDHVCRPGEYLKDNFTATTQTP